MTAHESDWLHDQVSAALQRLRTRSPLAPAAKTEPPPVRYLSPRQVREESARLRARSAALREKAKLMLGTRSD